MVSCSHAQGRSAERESGTEGSHRWRAGSGSMRGLRALVGRPPVSSVLPNPGYLPGRLGRTRTLFSPPFLPHIEILILLKLPSFPNMLSSSCTELSVFRFPLSFTQAIAYLAESLTTLACPLASSPIRTSISWNHRAQIKIKECGLGWLSNLLAIVHVFCFCWIINLSSGSPSSPW